MSNKTPPSQFLTWENLTKCPSILMDTHLDGLDWDTVPGLFDHQDAVKMMHIDLDIATSWWIEESYDVFNPDDIISHNLVLALFLTPNTQPQVELTNSIIGNYIFSGVVMYKLTVQDMCVLYEVQLANYASTLRRRYQPSLLSVYLRQPLTSCI